MVNKLIFVMMTHIFFDIGIEFLNIVFKLHATSG
jgi:hypothetical protein